MLRYPCPRSRPPPVLAETFLTCSVRRRPCVLPVPHVLWVRPSCPSHIASAVLAACFLAARPPTALALSLSLSLRPHPLRPDPFPTHAAASGEVSESCCTRQRTASNARGGGGCRPISVQDDECLSIVIEEFDQHVPPARPTQVRPCYIVQRLLGGKWPCPPARLHMWAAFERRRQGHGAKNERRPRGIRVKGASLWPRLSGVLRASQAVRRRNSGQFPVE